jgi:type VI secretion system secreted protein VgrG
MDKKGSTGSVISSYRKQRQQSNVIFVYGVAGLLVLSGLALLIIWLTGPTKPLNGLFATVTPTPTLTYTPTITPSPTDTPTVTSTSTLTPTLTPSAPFTYTIQEGDNLQAIATKFGLGSDAIPLILLLNPYDATKGTGIDPTTLIVSPDQQITIPNPGMSLPTATHIPANIHPGTKVTYTVQSGDSLAAIASEFNSTVDDIVKTNNLTDPNDIKVGQQLQISVNLVTPTATRPPTSTPRTPLPTVTPSIAPTS